MKIEWCKKKIFLWNAFAGRTQAHREVDAVRETGLGRARHGRGTYTACGTISERRNGNVSGGDGIDARNGIGTDAALTWHAERGTDATRVADDGTGAGFMRHVGRMRHARQMRHAGRIRDGRRTYAACGTDVTHGTDAAPGTDTARGVEFAHYRTWRK